VGQRGGRRVRVGADLRDGQPGHELSSRSVDDRVGLGTADRVQVVMERVGIPGGTAHRLRHWYGSNLVATGADLRTAQTLLRHANLNTTAIYVQVSDPKRVEAIDRLDPYG
jgi:site-specific recombinase XerD